MPIVKKQWKVREYIIVNNWKGKKKDIISRKANAFIIKREKKRLIDAYYVHSLFFYLKSLQQIVNT